jgi:hypothetical protein
MSIQLILNRSNYDYNSKRFVYKFNGNKRLVNYEVGLTTMNIYNSFYNISSLYSNNTFQFDFLGTIYNFKLTDGYYNISDLNLYLQNQCIINGLYLINDLGEYVYYCELLVNAVEYGVNVVFYPVPISLPTGWTKPTTATWAFPPFLRIPLLIIGSNFGKILGLTDGSYPLDATYFGGPGASIGTVRTVKNSIVPEVHTVSSVILTCNLINNAGFSNPTNIFYTFGFTEDFGQLIKINPPDVIYSKVIETEHSEIQIQLLDQNLQVISLLDTDAVITIVLREKKI